jgi:hypothetical protein
MDERKAEVSSLTILKQWYCQTKDERKVEVSSLTILKHCTGDINE